MNTQIVPVERLVKCKFQDNLEFTQVAWACLSMLLRKSTDNTISLLTIVGQEALGYILPGWAGMLECAKRISRFCNITDTRIPTVRPSIAPQGLGEQADDGLERSAAQNRLGQHGECATSATARQFCARFSCACCRQQCRILSSRIACGARSPADGRIEYEHRRPRFHAVVVEQRNDRGAQQASDATPGDGRRTGEGAGFLLCKVARCGDYGADMS